MSELSLGSNQVKLWIEFERYQVDRCVDNLNIPEKLLATNDNKLLDLIMAIEYKRKPT